MLRFISLLAVLASCQSKVNNQFSETKLECGAIENQSAFWIPIVDEQGRKLAGENISARIDGNGQSQPLRVSDKGCVGFEFDPGHGDELIIARDKPGELKGFIGPAKEVFDSYSSISMVSIQQKAFDFSCPVNGGLQNLFITSKAVQLNYRIDEALNHYEMKIYRGTDEVLSPPKLLAGPYLLPLEQLQEGVNDIVIELRSKLSDRYTYQKVCKVEKDTVKPRVTLTTNSESLELRPGQSLALTIEGANRFSTASQS
ncbi:hypothetical protein [Pseudobacteriovorax antillogorgiicola]|uniref:Uncharacterized protein n=1 Tax=Pseudobacteriovorax antillogorgiicola TaxID=1513793 RepID=A0A1Y6CT03_9BACT|nr:hypothetical protein [Pseudobacteriovorax antillogorgiicola]TCS45452.1 hypothetical protein EDD56_12863 [Pseudobacteriovorax antillogorgiicola]SMF74690.1 hypothetical protein SAMN06296036_12863 [Pseudobacteriovorax antillogorgiicola]